MKVKYTHSPSACLPDANLTNIRQENMDAVRLIEKHLVIGLADIKAIWPVFFDRTKNKMKFDNDQELWL